MTFTLFESRSRGLKEKFALAVYQQAIESGFSVLIVPLTGKPQLVLAEHVKGPVDNFALEDGRRVKVIRPFQK